MIPIERVQSDHQRTADYILGQGDRRLVVEVKQFDPNSRDRIILNRSPEEFGENEAFYDGMQGDRIRLKINKSMPQLRNLSKGILPTLIVLFDNVRLWPEICDPSAVKVAMHGVETILITNEVAPEGGAMVVDRWHGPHRKATSFINTTLSGIALLSCVGGHLHLDIFHNYFAAVPIDLHHFKSASVTHYRLMQNPEEAFTEWVSCIP
jgi:hypothetical protein